MKLVGDIGFHSTNICIILSPLLLLPPHLPQPN